MYEKQTIHFPTKTWSFPKPRTKLFPSIDSTSHPNKIERHTQELRKNSVKQFGFLGKSFHLALSPLLVSSPVIVKLATRASPAKAQLLRWRVRVRERAEKARQSRLLSASAHRTLARSFSLHPSFRPPVRSLHFSVRSSAAVARLRPRSDSLSLSRELYLRLYLSLALARPSSVFPSLFRFSFCARVAVVVSLFRLFRAFTGFNKSWRIWEVLSSFLSGRFLVFIWPFISASSSSLVT